MTRGGRRKGAGRPAKYPLKKGRTTKRNTKDFTLSWPPQAIKEAKERAKREEKSLSEYLLLRIFGLQFHRK